MLEPSKHLHPQRRYDVRLFIQELSNNLSIMVERFMRNKVSEIDRIGYLLESKACYVFINCQVNRNLAEILPRKRHLSH